MIYFRQLLLWDKIDEEDEVSQVNIERFKAAIIVVAMELLYSEETVHDYTTKRKTAHAYQLLKCGHSCSSVAESLGFTSLSSFSRWFKTYTGESPSQVELRQS
jgi:hypothetical protein